MYIDFKITMWERVDISEHPQKDEIIAGLKSGKITSAEQIFQDYPDDNIILENLDDTSKQMSVIDNDGQATIEICEPDSPGNTTWDNTVFHAKKADPKYYVMTDEIGNIYGILQDISQRNIEAIIANDSGAIEVQIKQDPSVGLSFDALLIHKGDLKQTKEFYLTESSII